MTSKNYQFVFIFLSTLALTACGTATPTYKNLYPSPSDAQLSFESDFDLRTNFSVNTEINSKQCGKYEFAGYLLKIDSIFLFDKPNNELKIQVPAEKTIGVSGRHFFSDGKYTSDCFPPTVFFTPEPNAKYVVKMNLKDRYCFMSVTKNGDITNLHAVYEKSPNLKCEEPRRKKLFFGLF
jgi:hypothetical protein